MSKLDQKLYRDLWRIKGQALAIVLVIAAGISLLVMSQGMITSLDETMRAYYERHRFADVFANATRTPVGVVRSLRDIDGVADLQGRVSGGALVDLPGVTAPISARMVSLPRRPETAINRVFLADGRLPARGRGDEVLVLKPFAEAHNLSLGDPLKATVYGAERTFRIVGFALSPEFIYVLPPGEFVTNPARFAIIWASEETLQAAFDLEGAYNDIVATLTMGATTPDVLDAIDRALAPYGGAGAYARDDHLSDRFLSEELRQLRTMSTSMTPIFLGVSIFLLNVVVTRLVHAEREQIGLLKAFGYSNRDVGWHYLKFALIIAGIGAAVGWLGGLWLGEMIAGIYSIYFYFPFLLYTAPFRMLGVAFAVSLISAGLGAGFAVRAATLLAPADAMRPAPPPKFARGTWFTDGITSRLDQSTRMILRRLGRQPLRASLTVLGVAAAMGLAAMMQFNFNSTDHMLDVSFNIADRSDVMASFAEPLHEGALTDLEKIDGVMLAEAVRGVAATLKNGAKSHRGGIDGVPEDAYLRRTLDKDLRPVDVRGEGLVLSIALAEILDVKPGDIIQAEIHEGRRPVLDLPVTGVTDTMIGTPAYLSMETLNRRLKEPDRVTGAYLRIDMAKKDQVYDELKALPKIAGVSLRREAYFNFQKVIDEGPGVFRNVMAICSIIIAAGVVYNSARIAFIERERDLASLRVLGFSKSEAGYVLLGEIGLLILASLPVGGLFGWLLWSYLATTLSTELYQIPLIYDPHSVGVAAVTVLISGLVAGALVQRDVNRIDLTAALKSRD